MVQINALESGEETCILLVFSRGEKNPIVCDCLLMVPHLVKHLVEINILMARLIVSVGSPYMQLVEGTGFYVGKLH